MIYDVGLMGGAYDNYTMFWQENGVRTVLIFSVTGHVLLKKIVGNVFIHSNIGDNALVQVFGVDNLSFVDNMRSFLYSNIAMNEVRYTHSKNYSTTFIGKNLAVLFRTDDEATNIAGTWKVSYDLLQTFQQLPGTLIVNGASIAADGTIIFASGLYGGNTVISTDGGVSLTTVDNVNNSTLCQIWNATNYAFYGYEVGSDPLNYRMGVYNGSLNYYFVGQTIRDFVYYDSDTIYVVVSTGTTTCYLYKLTVSTGTVSLLATFSSGLADSDYSFKITIDSGMIFIPLWKGLIIYDLSGTLLNTMDWSAYMVINNYYQRVFPIF